ncbi:tetratricopeptide repeat protein [Thermonema rossianum]|uniref:tetratricopeptide repeat protein n=1 Tax=Thermonema rossianum TaxID=55505 RepID=UPI0012F9CEF3|nr:tetratricopeptide repeat protein [Thermonema rossianum]
MQQKTWALIIISLGMFLWQEDIHAQAAPPLDTLIKAQQFEAAFAYLQEHCTQMTDDSCAYYYGLAFYGTGQYARADSAFRQAVARRPAWAEAWYAWGVSLYYQNREAEAKEKLLHCLKIDKRQVAAWTALAALALQGRKPRQSIRFARRAVAVDSTYSPAYYNLGLAYRYTGKDSLAADAFRRAVAYRPGWAEPYFSLAESYAEGGDAATALYWLDRLLTVAPFHVEGLLLRAQIYHQSGNKAAACADWQKAMQAGSDDARLLFERFCP